MTKIRVQREVFCPDCDRRIITQSPNCRCFECGKRWKIDWNMSAEEFWSFNSSPKASRFLCSKAEELGVDPKALRVLFNTQWDMDGREGTWIPYSVIPPDALKLAKAEGLYRDPIKLDHKSMISRIVKAVKRLEVASVSAAFASSLLSRRLDLRSPLGSLAHALHLKPHPFKKDRHDQCQRCGLEKQLTIAVNHNTFRRIMWAGNVRQGDLGYVLCDLESFTDHEAKLGRKEKSLLKKLFQAIRKLPPEAGLSELEKSITGLFPSNKRERQVALEILGSCGIVKPTETPSMHQQWVPPSERPEPTHFYRKEWRSPASCWTGVDGVNDEAIEFWFGKL